MKKFAIVLAAVMFAMTGCGKAGNNTETEASKTTESASDAKSDKDAVAYTVEGVEIIPGTDFAEAKDKLGEPVKYTEAASCYYDGMDKIFTYDGFEVRTYPKDGKDMIQDLCISSDKYKTAKGVTVGMGVGEVIASYGEADEINGKMYNYYEGDKYIYFFIMDDAVKYFGYAIKAGN